VIDLPSHKEWMDTMRDEMDLIARSEDWELIDLPSQCKSIRYKWVFNIKFGQIVRSIGSRPV